MLAGISLGQIRGRVLVSWDALEYRQREGLAKPVAERSHPFSWGALRVLLGKPDGFVLRKAGELNHCLRK